jgi:hypothetical protein
MEKSPFPHVYALKLSNYTAPQITEKPGRKWVEYGENNGFFEYLVDLYHTSPTNSAAISGISDLIYGGGLRASKGAKVDAYLELVKLFFPEDVRRVCHDLKLFGQAAFQVALEGGTITGAFHIPMDKLRPEICNDEGEIENWYYSDNWAQYTKKNYKPRPIPVLTENFEGKEAVVVIQTYSPGSFYFSPVDYQGGLQYAELEGEISNYHLNNIKNGLAPGMLINFNNGIPEGNEVKYDIEQAINIKFGGSSNAGRAIVVFNDSKERESSITPIPLSDAPQQYQFLSDECLRKIMVAHRITSPMLLGIKDNTGLGNNAEELEKSSILFTNTVIRPFQRLVIEAIDSILAFNGVTLPMHFEDLNPFKLDNDGDVVQTEESKEVAMSSDKPEFSVQDEAAWLAYLEDKGETMDDDLWELVSEEVVEDPDTEEVYATAHVKLFKRFAEPDNKSEDDSGIYRIRYRYSPLQTQANSRDFCIRMVANGKQGVVYRREDIDKMDGVVNTQFAPKGSSTYSIWKYKGGVNCHHAWFRLVYKRKQVNGKVIPLTEQEKAEGNGWRDLEENYVRKSTASARQAGVPSSKLDPQGIETAETRPIDMPNQGRKR